MNVSKPFPPAMKVSAPSSPSCCSHCFVKLLEPLLAGARGCGPRLRSQPLPGRRAKKASRPATAAQGSRRSGASSEGAVQQLSQIALPAQVRMRGQRTHLATAHLRRPRHCRQLLRWVHQMSLKTLGSGEAVAAHCRTGFALINHYCQPCSSAPHESSCLHVPAGTRPPAGCSPDGWVFNWCRRSSWQWGWHNWHGRRSDSWR